MFVFGCFSLKRLFRDISILVYIMVQKEGGVYLSGRKQLIKYSEKHGVKVFMEYYQTSLSLLIISETSDQLSEKKFQYSTLKVLV